MKLPYLLCWPTCFSCGFPEDALFELRFRIAGWLGRKNGGESLCDPLCRNKEGNGSRWFAIEMGLDWRTGFGGGAGVVKIHT